MSKAKIAFIRGPIVASTGSINNEATPCIAFAYLSSYIGGQGYSSEFVDAVGEGLNQMWPLEKYPGFSCQGLTFDRILERIPEDADVLAFSAMFSGEWPVIRDLIERVHERFPGRLIVAGGEHVTAAPEYSLRDCPAIDVIVRGEGEHSLLELLEAWREGDYSQVDGISFIGSDGAYVENGGLPRIREVDEIPWPNWPDGYLEKFWQAGKSFGIGSARDMPFMASRGCPYQCTFCSSPQMWTVRYILRDVDDCIDEIRAYAERYNITAIQFYDLTAITKKSWILEFCEKLRAANLDVAWSLPSGTRSEALDAQSLEAIANSGCNYLVYAPESAAKVTLKRIKKKIKIERLTSSMLEAMRRGITVRANLIVGFPGETRRDMLETLWWGLRMAARGADEVPVFLYNPYPGSELFWGLVDEGKIVMSDEYFFSLTSLNGKYLSAQSLSFNEHVHARELIVWRTVFMAMNFAVSYLFYPRRIFRTLKNVTSGADSSTVLEHRLKDALRRRSADRQSLQ